MSDLEDNIKNLLSSPDGMSNILSLVSGLTGQKTDSSGEGTESSDTTAPPDLSALSSIDPKILSAAMKIFGEYSSDDDKIKLLSALKPHLGDEKRGRIDKAALILRLSKSVRAAMRSFSGGEENV